MIEYKHLLKCNPKDVKYNHTTDKIFGIQFISLSSHASPLDYNKMNTFPLQNNTKCVDLLTVFDARRHGELDVVEDDVDRLTGRQVKQHRAGVAAWLQQGSHFTHLDRS